MATVADDQSTAGLLKNVLEDIEELKGEMTALRRAMIGSYDQPGGMAVAVQKNRADIQELRADRAEDRATREMLTEEYDARVTALERWKEQITNRAIGLVIGSALGSAGIGATVATIISRLLAP